MGRSDKIIKMNMSKALMKRLPKERFWNIRGEPLGMHPYRKGGQTFVLVYVDCSDS